MNYRTKSLGVVGALSSLSHALLGAAVGCSVAFSRSRLGAFGRSLLVHRAGTA
jgi:hypothetical protein